MAVNPDAPCVDQPCDQPRAKGQSRCKAHWSAYRRELKQRKNAARSLLPPAAPKPARRLAAPEPAIATAAAPRLSLSLSLRPQAYRSANFGSAWPAAASRPTRPPPQSSSYAPQSLRPPRPTPTSALPPPRCSRQ